MIKKYYKVIACLILAVIFLYFNTLLFWVFLVLAFVVWHKTRRPQVSGKQTIIKQSFSKKPASWFGRHPILTAILIVFGFFLLVNMINTPSNPSQDNSLPIPTYPTRSPKVIPKTTATPVYRPPASRTPTPVPTPIYTPPPTPVPTPIVVKSWHTITQFSGSGGRKNTDTFTVQGTQWRIIWTAYATNSYCLANGCNIYIYTYKPGDKTYTDNVTSTVSGSKTDTNYFYNNGTFYFDIISSNVDSWTITVEDYY